jgi:hypothetical protein
MLLMNGTRSGEAENVSATVSDFASKDAERKTRDRHTGPTHGAAVLFTIA